MTYECHQNIPKTLKIDIQRVKQILTNLIGNSLKFTSKGSIKITSKISVDETTHSDGHHFLEINVCDSGIGIKQEDKGKIFQMFGKLEATAKINTSGVG